MEKLSFKDYKRTWRKRLLKLVGFLLVKDAESVEVLRASDLELNNVFASLDLHGSSIFPPCCQKEVLNLVNLLRLHTFNNHNHQNNVSISKFSVTYKFY